MPVRMMGPEERWIVRSHISWGGERNILYNGVKTFPSRHVLKTSRKSPNRTISASGGGLGLSHDMDNNANQSKEAIHQLNPTNYRGTLAKLMFPLHL